MIPGLGTLHGLALEYLNAVFRLVLIITMYVLSGTTCSLCVAGSLVVASVWNVLLTFLR